MPKPLLITLIIFLSVWCRVYSQHQADDSLKALVSRYGQAEVAIQVQDTSKVSYLGRTYSFSSYRDGILSLRISQLTIDSFINLGQEYKILPLQYEFRSRSRSLQEVMEWDSYPSYDQYVQIMKQFTEQYPGFCVLDTIGVSNLGKLVLALKISDNAHTTEEEPEVFYSSTIHGDETGGFILMMRLADHLLKNYETDNYVKNIVDNLQIWINPLANPDGTYRNGNLIITPSRFNANGYDLNRNFPDPEQAYSGSNIQQRETTDMVRFLEKHKFVLSANFHSGEEVVNYPWDRWERLHADNNWFYRISRAYADTVHKYSARGYMDAFDNGVVRGIRWYRVNGGRQDYVTYELQGREITIELDEDYITPEYSLNTLWQYNYRSLLRYLGNALYGIHGRVRDINNSTPIAARIFIKDHDIDNSHVYSDTLYGRFTRLLYAGSYDLFFTAVGYKDLVMTNIRVSDLERTYLNAGMIPLQEHDRKYPVIYPVPAVNSINVILPVDFTGNIHIEIYSTSGRRIMDYTEKVSPGKELVIRIPGLSSGVYIGLFRKEPENICISGKFIIVR